MVLVGAPGENCHSKYRGRVCDLLKRRICSRRPCKITKYIVKENQHTFIRLLFSRSLLSIKRSDASRNSSLYDVPVWAFRKYLQHLHHVKYPARTALMQVYCRSLR